MPLQTVNQTRWLSIGNLIERTDIMTQNGLMDINFGGRVPEELLLTDDDVILVDRLKAIMAKINSATQLIQSDSYTLGQVEATLDVLKAEPGMNEFFKGDHLDKDYSKDAMDERGRGTREERDLFRRHRNFYFERAVVKIQKGQILEDEDELGAVEHLRKPVRPDVAAGNEHIHPGGEFMRRMKDAAESSMASATGDYVDLSHVIGTSDIVERLFSACKHIMSDCRKKMGPETLDLIVMLKYNQDLWNDDRNKESPHMAARIIHIDNEEKKKIRRLREEQARAAQPRDNDSDNNDSDNNDNI